MQFVHTFHCLKLSEMLLIYNTLTPKFAVACHLYWTVYQILPSFWALKVTEVLRFSNSKKRDRHAFTITNQGPYAPGINQLEINNLENNHQEKRKSPCKNDNQYTIPQMKKNL